MQAKKLAAADFETGMAIEAEMAAAVEAVKNTNAGYQLFVAVLRKKYDAPASAWTLTDWAQGFVPITGGNGDG
jgi:hypothetical protein